MPWWPAISQNIVYLLSVGIIIWSFYRQAQFVSKNWSVVCLVWIPLQLLFFHVFASPKRKKKNDFAVRSGYVNIERLEQTRRILFCLLCCKFKTITGGKKNTPTFDFLIFKLGLLGRSGPLNHVLMLNDAILTATRFNSLFRLCLLSMIHKRSWVLKEHAKIYCPLEVKRIFKIPTDRIVTLR